MTCLCHDLKESQDSTLLDFRSVETGKKQPWPVSVLIKSRIRWSRANSSKISEHCVNFNNFQSNVSIPRLFSISPQRLYIAHAPNRPPFTTIVSTPINFNQREIMSSYQVRVTNVSLRQQGITFHWISSIGVRLASIHSSQHSVPVS